MVTVALAVAAVHDALRHGAPSHSDTALSPGSYVLALLVLVAIAVGFERRRSGRRF